MKAVRSCCSRPIAPCPTEHACFDFRCSPGHFPTRGHCPMIMARPLGFLMALALCVGSAQAAAPSARAQYGDFGREHSAQDKSIEPGDDFYRYAAGHWLATHTIP